MTVPSDDAEQVLMRAARVLERLCDEIPPGAEDAEIALRMAQIMVVAQVTGNAYGSACLAPGSRVKAEEDPPLSPTSVADRIASAIIGAVARRELAWLTADVHIRREGADATVNIRVTTAPGLQMADLAHPREHARDHSGIMAPWLTPRAAAILMQLETIARAHMRPGINNRARARYSVALEDAARAQMLTAEEQDVANAQKDGSREKKKGGR